MQQFLSAKLKHMQTGISMEEALIELGLSSDTVKTAKKALNISLTEKSTEKEIQLDERIDEFDEFNELTEAIWNVISKNLTVRQKAPRWVQRKLDIPFQEIIKLPTFNEIARLTIVDEKLFNRRPEARSRVLSQSFLDTLQSKIDKDNLGEEFIQICKRRILSLEPYIGQNILNVGIYGEGSFLLDLKADGLTYIHAEEISLKLIQETAKNNRSYFY